MQTPDRRPSQATRRAAPARCPSDCALSARGAVASAIAAGRDAVVARIVASLVAFALTLAQARPLPAQLPPRASDLHLAAPITTWDEALPLGNGMLGGLLWGTGNRLTLSLDRGDLWDLRPAAPFGRPGYTYSDMARLVREGKEDSLHLRFDEPYDNIAYPTKIPAGRLSITLDPSQRATDFTLRLASAEAAVRLTTGEVHAFFSAVQRVAFVQLPAGAAVTIERPASLSKLGYAPATFRRDGSMQFMEQEAALGLRYVVAVGERRTGNALQLAVTVTSSADGADPAAVARRLLTRALATGYDSALAPHVQWWRRFWDGSRLTVPDTALQAHLDLTRYYYGAAARAGAPPIPLQGVWTADSDALPPWKGDLHNDLNTQMTYLAAHVGGEEEAMRGWLDYNWSRRDRYRAFARDFYGTPGYAVPGVMALDGQPLGGWAQYSLSPTMGAWVAQSFYLQWRYTMDPRFLRERAYPFTVGIGTALAALLKPSANGRLRLPLSSSPEIFDNSMRAWLATPSNFDIALMRWLYGALAEMADARRDREGAHRWRDILSALDPLVIDPASGALVFAAGLPYAESHRHFSHAMALHPLALLDAGAPSDSATMRATIDLVAAQGTSWWTGYSFAWFSAMLARSGRGDEALEYLETYRRAFILRNGFHANGDQTRSGLSRYTYRPFTLEGNFLALHAAQEMVVQSWGGVVRVFPAVSDRWRDVAFHQLRAEGGFVVSASRVGGRTTRVEVRAPRGGDLRLRDPFPGARVKWIGARARRDGADYVIPLRAGATVVGVRVSG